MVYTSSSSRNPVPLVSEPEKETRIARKIQVHSSSRCVYNIYSSVESECLGSEFSNEKHCLDARKELETVEFQNPDWSDHAAADLEKLVISYLDAIYNIESRHSISLGYVEEASMQFLPGYKFCHKNSCRKLHPQLALYDTLERLFFNIKEASPVLLSRGEAMWRLLLSDMDAIHAHEICSYEASDGSSTSSQPKGASTKCAIFNLETSDTRSALPRPDKLSSPSGKKERTLRLSIFNLQKMMKHWTEWADQKVMQATHRLSVTRDEIKILKEKDASEHLKKEMEENVNRKLSLMEIELAKVSNEAGQASLAVSRLELEQTVLRQEWEAASKHEDESNSSCQEAAENRKRILTMIRSLKKQQATLQEELKRERHQMENLLRELEEAKRCVKEVELRRKQEEKQKEELLMQSCSKKMERQKSEASEELYWDMITLTGEKKKQRYKDEIQRLEKEICCLRSNTDYTRIAALWQSYDRGNDCTLGDVESGTVQKSWNPFDSPIVGLLACSDFAPLRSAV